MLQVKSSSQYLCRSIGIVVDSQVPRGFILPSNQKALKTTSLEVYYNILCLILKKKTISSVIGEKIEAKSHDDVTMLFSDIVGFTSICATATPMMVIAMLEDLYSVFDIFCEELDVYKVNFIVI